MSTTGPVIPKEVDELRYPAVNNFRSIHAACFLAIGIYLLAIFLFSPNPVLPHHDKKADSHHAEKAGADAQHSTTDPSHEQTEKPH